MQDEEGPHAELKKESVMNICFYLQFFFFEFVLNVSTLKTVYETIAMFFTFLTSIFTLTLINITHKQGHIFSIITLFLLTLN